MIFVVNVFAKNKAVNGVPTEPSIWQDVLKENSIKRFSFKTTIQLLAAVLAKVSSAAKGTTVLKAIILKPGVVCHDLKYHTILHTHTHTHAAICSFEKMCIFQKSKECNQEIP